jgi:orotidine-5'-phosphate decarboxylase
MPINEPAPRDRLIFALDVPNLSQALYLCGALKDHVGMFKVGLELYAAIGRKGLMSLMNVLGHGKPRIMLDLKLHDIPTTVYRTIKQFHDPSYGVRAITVHTAGGPSMLKKAVEASGDIQVFAVTALTSMSDEDVIAVDNFDTARECVLARARVALNYNCDAIVASPIEASDIRDNIGGMDVSDNWVRPMIVTPGIRMHDAPEDDQKRSATPAEAIQRGADYLVVGRPIRDTDDPATAADTIVKEISNGLSLLRTRNNYLKKLADRI